MAAWKPLLTGAQERQARQVIQEIAEALRSPEPDWLRSHVNLEVTYPSLGGLDPKIGLFFYYLFQDTDDPRDENTATDIFEQAIDSFSQASLGLGLFGGRTGMAWLLAHAVEEADEDEEQDSFLGIDTSLGRLLFEAPEKHGYDLISGLVGFGVYLLERLPHRRALELLETLVQCLENLSQPAPSGVTWHTPPALLPAWQREEAPDGYYNVGLAHGVPGIIGLLAQIHEAQIAQEQTQALLEKAVDWLLAQKIPSSSKPQFPGWVVVNKNPTPTRVAWCYGDLGISLVLLLAARCMGNQAWEEEALAIARNVSKLSPEESGILDAGLCHGSAGNAHLYNRLYQATGEQAFAEAALESFTWTLDFRRPGRGIAGFQHYFPSKTDDGPPWRDDVSFLTGAAGVGLALLAATSHVEPNWDGLLLTAVSPKLR
jgi:lantibiotic modifying enzyme